MKETFPARIETKGLISRDLKLMCVPTPKAGCTSIKWAMATAQGTLSPQLLSAQGETQQLIHGYARHGLPNFASLGAKERSTILHDPSWIRFCVIRDPYSRLLSGWINRVLLEANEGPGADRAFAHESWDQSVPTDLGQGFRDFVRRLIGPAAPAITDQHFRSQMSLLRPDVFPYTDIVKINELDEFVARVAASSIDRSRFDPQPMNRSLRIDPQSVFDSETASLVDAYFAEDFEQFGYPRIEFAQTASPVPLSTREMELISIVRAKSNRIPDIWRISASDSSLRRRVSRKARAIRRRLRTLR